MTPYAVRERVVYEVVTDPFEEVIAEFDREEDASEAAEEWNREEEGEG